MILNVKVVVRAKVSRIQKITDNSLKIYVKAPAEDNKANKALIEALSGYYGVRKNQVSIKSGEKSHNKIIEVLK